LKLGYAVEKAKLKAGLSSDTTAPQSTPKQMVVTIHDESGNPVLNGERYDLVKIGEEYYSKSILLPTGNYTLEEFMVIDSADQAVYISPKNGSKLADFVEHPLPRSFQVEEDQDKELMVQVVPAWLGSASEFGYVSFPFEVVNPSAMSVSPGLCATYEEDKLRLNACYDSKECLIGSWRFKAFIDTDSCLVEYTPDSINGKPVNDTALYNDTLYSEPWIQFFENDSLAGESVTNFILPPPSREANMYQLGDESTLQFTNYAITQAYEPKWGNRFRDMLSNYSHQFNSFNDTLFLYNSKTKMLFIKFEKKD
jgi:hypothetical protein